MKTEYNKTLSNIHEHKSLRTLARCRCFNRCGCTFYAAATVRMNEANRDMVAFTRARTRTREMVAVHLPHREHAAVTQSFKPKLAVKKPTAREAHLGSYA